LTLRAFGNLDLEYRSDQRRGEFSLGELDLFASSELSDTLSVLAEVVLEPDAGGEFVLDVERYQLRYAPLDALHVTVGRMHTALGFWNQTYHHGKWFQTTAERPEVYNFEDHGGVLPLHEVGVQALGRARLAALSIDCSVSVSNGRGETPGSVQSIGDLDGHKAVNVWLAGSPRGVPGTQGGAVLRFDRIPAGRAGEAMRERVSGIFAVYQRSRVEVLAEAFRITHEGVESGRSYRTEGLYVQGSARLGGYRVYYRFDDLDLAEADPFYALREFRDPDPTLLGDVTAHTLGARFDPWPWTAVKVEVVRQRPRPGPAFWIARVQAAYTF
jgi:hypothetical protein